MSGTPWKIRSACKTLIGQTRSPEDAVAVVALQSAGAIISHDDGEVLWTEGHEAFTANDSHGAAVNVIYARINAYNFAANGALADGKSAREACRAGHAALQAVDSDDHKPQ